jgi:transposase InsO family protein
VKLPPISTPSELNAETLFRFQVVSQVLVREATGSSRASAVAEVAAAVQLALNGQWRQVSTRTLYRWLAVFELGGYRALAPAQRVRTDSSVVLSEDFCDFLREQKKDDPEASIPELILRARVLGVIEQDAPIDRSTVYRACKRMGLPVQRRRKQRGRDSRRFAFPHRMDMVLCDGKHFRAGIARRKRVALIFLDDCTRNGLHVVVGSSENKRLFLRGLYETIRRHGLMSGLYLDRGPGFIALDTFDVVAQLGSLLIHGEKAYPSGHGKIERLNQTTLNDVLRSLDGHPGVDPDCGALEIRLGHYFREQYNQRPHESLEQRSPAERFAADPRPLRFPQSDDALRERFVLHRRRRVSLDHVVSIDRTHYEMPRGYSGAWVVLRHQILDNAVRFRHHDELITIKPVDLVANARTRRGKRSAAPDAGRRSAPPPKTAAHLLFEKEHQGAVTTDGDCINPINKEDP